MRSEEYLNEYDHVLSTLAPETSALVMDGSIEICPACNEVSAYAWQYANAYESNITTHGMKLASGGIGHIGCSSCWEWQCPHCMNSIMDASSPLNHPCYTHADDADDYSEDYDD